jgi:6-phosphogluconolactonase (cycloisomerase 2 family)
MYFVVADQSTNRLHVFSRDLKNGKLTDTGTTYPVNLASSIVFV